MNDTTYVLGDAEVKKTGRTAEKKLPSGKQMTIYEITPVDTVCGTWKKWVSDAELYTVLT